VAIFNKGGKVKSNKEVSANKMCEIIAQSVGWIGEARRISNSSPLGYPPHNNHYFNACAWLKADRA